jgi:hypothetical protein
MPSVSKINIKFTGKTPMVKYSNEYKRYLCKKGMIMFKSGLE